MEAHGHFCNVYEEFANMLIATLSSDLFWKRIGVSALVGFPKPDGLEQLDLDARVDWSNFKK